MGPTPFYGARAKPPPPKVDFAMMQTNICRLSGDMCRLSGNINKYARTFDAKPTKPKLHTET